MRYGTFLLLTLCGFGLAGSARAAITYEYVTDQTTYSPTAAGQTVTVTLYLQETATNGSSSLIAAEGGLFGAGIYAGQTNVSPSSATGTTITAINPNSQKEPDGFTGNGGSGSTATTAYLSEAVANSDNSAGPSGSTKGGSITSSNGTTITDVFLGTLTLKAGDVGSTTTFTLLSLKNSPSGTPGSGFDGNTLTFTNFDDLDPNSPKGFSPAYTGADSFVGSTAYTFQVAVATPEPGSFVLGAVAASGLALGAWRRWRKRAAAKA